jgi:hypothetical protein
MRQNMIASTLSHHALTAGGGPTRERLTNRAKWLMDVRMDLYIGGCYAA